MELKKTHLYEFHKKHAKMTEFAGFEMPLWYEGIIQEHLTVRESVGVFDVTHMGRFIISGREAIDFLNSVLTRDVASMNIFQGKLSLICNERGGIVDDVFVFRLKESKFLLIGNAINHEKDYELLSKLSSGFSVNVEDISERTAMFAVQGPKSPEIARRVLGLNLYDLRYGYGRWIEKEGHLFFVSRTGYTGEDGFEIIIWDSPLCSPEKAQRMWEAILDAGRDLGLKPCGLGARDTLRIEAGFCLYGNDINDTITPLEARLDFAVSFEKPYFMGKEALLRQRAEGVKRVRVGFRLLESGIPRPGCKILSNGTLIGEVTSGTFSPLLKCGIGMGYVPPEFSSVGRSIEVQIRDRAVKAGIEDMPFYDTTRYGRKRRI